MFNAVGLNEKPIAVLNFSDEILTIIFGIYVFVNCKKIKDIYICFLSTVFLAIGYISSLIWGEQNLLPVLQDSFVCVKFIIAYIFGAIFFKNKRNIFLTYIVAVSKIAVWVVFIVGILHIEDFLSGIGEKNIFLHQTSLTHFAVLLLIIFTYIYFKTGKSILYLILSSALVFLALTSKGIGFLGLYWISFFLLFKGKFKNRYLLIISGVLFALLLTWEDVIAYFFSSGYSPRRILLTDSFKVAIREFPFGTGFGSFGSAVAYKYYSPIYYDFGYTSNYGMGPDLSTNFMCDSFWPCIFAQFGIGGMIIFLLIIIHFIFLGNKIYRIDKRMGFLCFMIMLYLLIVSIAETSFFGPESVIFFLVFAYIENRTLDLSDFKKRSLT